MTLRARSHGRVRSRRIRARVWSYSSDGRSLSAVPALREAVVALADVEAPVSHALLSQDRKSTRLNSSHLVISYAVFCLINKGIYDPVLARFMMADPLIQSASNLQDYNRYSYGSNNPLCGVDPTGYSWLSYAVHSAANSI